MRSSANSEGGWRPPLRSPKWGPFAPTAPERRALRPSTPGGFPVAGKVTKGAPRAVPFGIPRCVVTALFALAALRSGSRRATFCHKNRPICHFETVGKLVFFSLQALPESHLQLSIRGTAGVLPSRVPRAFLPATNTARVESGGIQGGPPLVLGVQGPGGPWRIFAYFLYARK